MPTLAGTYLLRTFSGWKLFDGRGGATVPSFAGCTNQSVIGFCRSEPFFGSGPYPKANTQPFNQWPTAFPQPTLTISGDTNIYLDPADLRMKRKTGSTVTTMDNCIVTKDPSAAYAGPIAASGTLPPAIRRSRWIPPTR